MFDKAVVSVVEAVAHMKPRLTPDYQRIPDEIGALACERNRLRRRWQRTRDPADRAVFNRASGKLKRDMRTFRNRSWELAVTQMDRMDEDRNAWSIPSTPTGKRRRAPIPAMQGPRGHILGRPEQKAEFLAHSFER